MLGALLLISTIVLANAGHRWPASIALALLVTAILWPWEHRQKRPKSKSPYA